MCLKQCVMFEIYNNFFTYSAQKTLEYIFSGTTKEIPNIKPCVCCWI